MAKTESVNLDLPVQPKWLTFDPENLTASYAQVGARISNQGRLVAELRAELVFAKKQREKEEALVYQLARVELEMAGKGGSRGVTEGQVAAHTRSEPHLDKRIIEAYKVEAVAEAQYEVARVDLDAMRREAEMLVSAGADRRAELNNLDPMIRNPR